MFSPHDIDHVAWFLVLLMGGWVVVNALVDLSDPNWIAARRRKAAQREEAADQRSSSSQADSQMN